MPLGDPVGTVDDLVLDMDHSIEKVIVTDGGLFGAGEQVAIDFGGSGLTTEGGGDDAKVGITLTDQALEQAAEFDESQLDAAGDRLASWYLERSPALASACWLSVSIASREDHRRLLRRVGIGGQRRWR